MAKSTSALLWIAVEKISLGMYVSVEILSCVLRIGFAIVYTKSDRKSVYTSQDGCSRTIKMIDIEGISRPQLLRNFLA